MEGVWQESLLQCPAARRGGRGARLLLPGALQGRAGLAAGRAHGSAVRALKVGRAHTQLLFSSSSHSHPRRQEQFSPGRNKCRCPQSAKAA